MCRQRKRNGELHWKPDKSSEIICTQLDRDVKKGKRCMCVPVSVFPGIGWEHQRCTCPWVCMRLCRCQIRGGAHLNSLSSSSRLYSAICNLLLGLVKCSLDIPKPGTTPSAQHGLHTHTHTAVMMHMEIVPYDSGQWKNNKQWGAQEQGEMLPNRFCFQFFSCWGMFLYSLLPPSADLRLVIALVLTRVLASVQHWKHPFVPLTIDGIKGIFIPKPTPGRKKH